MVFRVTIGVRGKRWGRNTSLHCGDDFFSCMSSLDCGDNFFSCIGLFSGVRFGILEKILYISKRKDIDHRKSRNNDRDKSRIFRYPNSDTCTYSNRTSIVDSGWRIGSGRRNKNTVSACYRL